MGRGWIRRRLTAAARRAVAATVVVTVVVTVVASVGPPGPAAAALALPSLRPIVLPRDHAAHPGFQVEWWYTAGTVTARHGHRYFWFATIWSGAPGMIARVNLVDLHTDRVVLSRQFLTTTAAHTGQTRFRVQGFVLNWTRGDHGLGTWAIVAPTAAGRLRLELTPAAPYVLHGSGGIIQQGPAAKSAYYSEPRLEARGALTLNGRRRSLTGLGWLDHQWGNFADEASSLRWNWFACQLADGRDLMLYQFLNARDRPSGFQAGTLVSAAGVTHITRFSVTGLPPSITPAGTTTAYPLRWRLSVPALGPRPLTLRALARHQYIHNMFLPSFWEGAAAITHGPPGGCIVESTREVAAGL